MGKQLGIKIQGIFTNSDGTSLDWKEFASKLESMGLLYARDTVFSFTSKESSQVEFPDNKRALSAKEVIEGLNEQVLSFNAAKEEFKETKLEISKKGYTLKKGSIAYKPKEDMMYWKDNGETYLKNLLSFEKHVEECSIEDKGDYGVLLKDITFNSPSPAGCLVSGASENGWTFFEGLNKLRYD